MASWSGGGLRGERGCGCHYCGVGGGCGDGHQVLWRCSKKEQCVQTLIITTIHKLILTTI